MRGIVLAFLLLVGLLLCYAYDQYVYTVCRDSGLSSVACLVAMGSI